MGPAFSRWRSAALSAQLLLATAWCGALWTIGYVVAPGLFAALPDRVLAGSLAGRFFAAVGWIGLVAGALIVVVSAVRGGWNRRSATLATASVIIAKKIARTRSENRPMASASRIERTSAIAVPAAIDDQVGPQL